MKILPLISALFFFFAAASSGQAPPYNWPVHDSFTIIDTVSTLQFYGPTPGFHHGLDINAPAGTPIYAPVDGVVGMGYYYPRAQVPYTYEVSVDGDEGFRWEFHHVDKETIPKEIADLANRHGRLERGTLLARIYDAPKFDPNIPPHVHVDVIDRDGIYQNPLKFFAPLPDKTAPKIQGIYLVDANNHVLAGKAPGIDLPVLLPAGKYELVLDVIDVIDGAPMGDSVSRLSVSANGTSIGNLDFLDHLPKKSYLEGVKDAYKIEPITLPDGKTLMNQVDLSEPRKFLYRFDLDTSRIAVGADHVIQIQIMAQDFAKNSTRSTLKLKTTMPP
jgi:hypothetical protein